jgi:hypothetical protein
MSRSGDRRHLPDRDSITDGVTFMIKVNIDHPLALYQLIIDAGGNMLFWFKDDLQGTEVEALVIRLKSEVSDRWHETRDIALRGAPILELAGESAAAVLAKQLGVEWSQEAAAVLPLTLDPSELEGALLTLSIDRRVARALVLVKLINRANIRPEITAREMIAIASFCAGTRQTLDMEACLQAAVSFYKHRCNRDDSSRFWEQEDNLTLLRRFLMEVVAYIARTALAAEELDKTMDQLRQECVALVARDLPSPDLTFLLDEIEAMIGRR